MSTNVHININAEVRTNIEHTNDEWFEGDHIEEVVVTVKINGVWSLARTEEFEVEELTHPQKSA